MRRRLQKIAVRYFVQTVALCFGLAVALGLLYAYLQHSTESQWIRLGFGFLSVISIGACLASHAHFVLVRPLQKLRDGLIKLDSQALISEDFVVLPSSDLNGEFAEIESQFHDLIRKLHARHREVLLTKNNLSTVSARFHENKLNALGEMAAGIAHEINNPLAILVGRLEQMRELLECDAGPRVLSVLQSMEKTAFRIQEAVADLELIASNPSSEELRAVNLSRLLMRLGKVVRGRFEMDQILFELLIQTDVEIEGREVELSQALLYILENSAEAARKSKTSDRWVKIQLKYENETSCLITISDSGSGLEKDLRNNLFQPFFTTKDEGRGMGLSLAKSMIDGHKGRIHFDFDSGPTTVKIQLPREQSVPDLKDPAA